MSPPTYRLPLLVVRNALSKAGVRGRLPALPWPRVTEERGEAPAAKFCGNSDICLLPPAFEPVTTITLLLVTSTTGEASSPEFTPVPTAAEATQVNGGETVV